MNRDAEKVDAEEFIAKKGLQAKGKRVSPFDVSSVAFVEPLVKEGDVPAEASEEAFADGVHAGENQAGEIDNSDVEDPLDLNIDDDDAQLSLF